MLLSLLAVTTVSGALILHSAAAHFYYRSNLALLQIAASLAVSRGAQYLPADPQAAVQIADRYAGANGVLPDEIAFTGVTADNRTLRIRLVRRVPLYIAALTVGLPSHEIVVTASAHRQRETQSVQFLL
jgi:hypothetical protein